MNHFVLIKFYACKLVVVCLVLMVGGCKTVLNVQGNFPTPVIDTMPLSVGLIVNKDFVGYSYIEKDEDRSEWDISFGEAQVKLIEVVLDAMFTKTTRLTEFTASSDNSIDLYIRPSIEKFQYNIPDETRGKMFSVWLKYNFQVFDHQENIIADWILTAYGKTPSSSFTTDESALNDAMVIALRDLGAGLALNFRNVPEINRWLQVKMLQQQAVAFELRKNKIKTESTGYAKKIE